MVDFPGEFVSVIIPVLNNLEGLKKCLTALENQTYPKNLYEVIVVDNGSDDNLEDLISSRDSELKGNILTGFRQFKQARLTYESCMSSYAARNQGISVSKGQILAFTDSDCIPNQDWLENGVKRLLSVPNCGLVGGKINFFYQNPQQPNLIELYDSVTFLSQKRYIEQEQYGATANLFTFKKIFDNVGFFNSNLQSGGDKEWGKRVAHYNYTLVYAENACIAHPARASFKEISKKIIRTRTGGYDLATLNKKSNNQVFLPFQLLINLARLRPPTRTAFEKIYSTDVLKNNQQIIQVLFMIFLMHYWALWIEMKLYITRTLQKSS